MIFFPYILPLIQGYTCTVWIYTASMQETEAFPFDDRTEARAFALESAFAWPETDYKIICKE